MFKKIAATLLCSSAPAAVFAQAVDLRSPDDFISVSGEIVGFNGVMLRVQTTVGTISVPASEVICFGEGCNTIVASNDFGLTADAFQDIVTVSATTEDVPQPRSDTLTVAFGNPQYGALYSTLANAFAVTSSETIVTLGANRSVSLVNDATAETATVSVTDDVAAADIVLESVSLNGTDAQAFSDPSGWAEANVLPYQMIGMNAYTVMVAPNAAIDSISLSDLARIFAGEITNWSQIGGADINILPLKLPTETVVGQEIDRLVMQPAGKTSADFVLTMADQGGIVTSINQFPGSVSIVSAARANPDLAVAVSGACGTAVSPTDFNVTSGDYPLVTAIVASYNTTPETGLATELFDFASAEIAQGLISAEGFVSHASVQQPAAEKNGRLSGLLGAALDDAQRAAAAQKFQILFDADRLSPTLIGGAVSGPEGAWNRAMMLDVIDAMADPANEGREVIFVGQGQSTAGSQAAISASAIAAATMRDMFAQQARDVIASNNLTLSSYGFGNVSPATCIDGQVANPDFTRIEVWIR